MVENAASSTSTPLKVDFPADSVSTGNDQVDEGSRIPGQRR